MNVLILICLLWVLACLLITIWLLNKLKRDLRNLRWEQEDRDEADPTGSGSRKPRDPKHIEVVQIGGTMSGDPSDHAQYFAEHQGGKMKESRL